MAKTAVYRGREVVTFSHDLSNYAKLRSGLSSSMRAQTLTKAELSKATPEQIERYINELNIWRTTPQSEKLARAKASKTSGLETLFNKAVQSNYFSSAEKQAMATANLKLKNMSPEQARMELSENLNAIDRVHAGGFYNDPESYFDSKYYIDNGSWDPALANDDMLRCVIYNDMLTGKELEEAIEEFIDRIGETSEEQLTGYASERAGVMEDLLGMAKLFLR